MRIVLSYLQIDAMLKWLHVNMVNRDNECSGRLLCNHLGRQPDFVIFWRDPDLANLPRKESHILTILTRTSLANENLKVST